MCVCVYVLLSDISMSVCSKENGEMGSSAINTHHSIVCNEWLALNKHIDREDRHPQMPPTHSAPGHDDMRVRLRQCIILPSEVSSVAVTDATMGSEVKF